MKPLSRREWLARASAVVAGTALSPSITLARESEVEEEVDATKLHPEFPSQNPARVQEVVRFSHFNLDRVKELVTASPALARAAWDWGFGDWESALGAASHMGRHDIAEVLIENGARPNIFTFTMLGNLEVVEASVAAMPGIQKTLGPHGLTLLHHAQNGGDRAKAVYDYLVDLGDADNWSTSLPVDDSQKATYLGKYRFGKEDDAVLNVTTSKRSGDLRIGREGRTPRLLKRVEEHGFSPAGAQTVRIRFAVEDGKATVVTVHDPDPIVRGVRVAN